MQVMLIHGGNDQALNAGFHDNSLGNPLLLRQYDEIHILFYLNNDLFIIELLIVE